MLANNNKSPLATNRFHTKEDAIKAVKKLYSAGAMRAEIDPFVYDEQWRIEKEGGPYAVGLTVTFPKQKVGAILKVIRELEPEGVENYDNLVDEPGP